jgi:molybdopterin converting factor small subunit
MSSREVTVRFFGPARQQSGASSVAWPCPPSGVPARRLIAEIGAAYPALAPTLRVSRFVRNGAYLRSLGARLRPGDEFAVHPPYGGG